MSCVETPGPINTHRTTSQGARVRKVVLYVLMPLDGAVDHPNRYFALDQEPGEVPEFDSVMVENEERLSNGWHNAEDIHGPVESLVRDLEVQPGGDIGVHGSIQLAQSLLEVGLVDELRLVGPAFGWPGRRLFAKTDDVRRLHLLSAVPTPRGSLLLAYRMR